LKFKVIACETLKTEIEKLLPEGVELKSFKFGPHRFQDELRQNLKEEIDRNNNVDCIFLGYGLCGKGTLGLCSHRAKILIPRIGDCIGIFLGSRKEYKKQYYKEPGTFYLTKGWIESGDDPYSEYLKLCEKYDQDRALSMAKQIIKNYKRIGLINLGNQNIEKYREYAQKVAETSNLRFKEIRGSNSLIKKLLAGEWDQEFIVVQPGEKINYDMFYNNRWISSKSFDRASQN